MKTITLQVHDISERPTNADWYYVLAVKDGNLLAIDWLRFDGQGWHDRYSGKVDLTANSYVYWFDLGPVAERTNDES